MISFLKFLVVGTIGFTINTVALVFGVRIGFKPSISGPVGAEIAILSNFLLNNLWTFSDRSITSWNTLPMKFIQFNLLSLGSVLIQFVFLKVGESVFGLEEFKKPILESTRFKNFFLVVMANQVLQKLPSLTGISKKFSAYMVVYMFGVGVGLVWNFIMYSQVIWRTQ